MKSNRSLFLALLLVAIFFTGCGPSQNAADNLTLQTTEAPVSTATPAPSPTWTVAPTKNPFAGELVDGKLVMSDLAYTGMIEMGETLYNREAYIAEIFLYEAMLEYSLKPDQLERIYWLQSDDYNQMGQYDLAIENYLKVLEMGSRKSFTLNQLCWNYGITDRAEDALPYCEEAVKQESTTKNLDSRGLVYALLGRYPEAQSDFEEAIKLNGYPNEELIASRQGWVTTLKTGKNPVTPDALKLERAEQVSLSSPPIYTGDLKLSYLLKYYEEEGYLFENTTVEGQPAMIAHTNNEDCTDEIILLGNEQAFLGGTITISGCSHEDASSRAWIFVAPYTRDLKELLRAIVWQAADWYYVIEGKPVSDLNPVYGGFQFTVERTSVDGKDGIIVTARSAE